MSYAEPLGRFVQFSTRASALGSVSKRESLDFYSYGTGQKIRESYPEAMLHYYIGLAWYPSTRTSITGSMDADYFRAYDYDYIEYIPEDYGYYYRRDSQDIRKTEIDFSVSVDYYLSRNVFFTIRGGVGYTDTYASFESSQKRKEWDYRLESSLRYQVF